MEVAGVTIFSEDFWICIFVAVIGELVFQLVCWIVKTLAAAARDEFKKWYEKTADDES